jgi:histidinol-phosphate phosphatase family protein
MTKALFLDRDGTLIEETGYLKHAAHVRLIDGVAENLIQAKADGFLLFLVTNQSGIGRGIITEQQFMTTTSQMLLLLGKAGAAVHDIAFCPHAPDSACPCRKPSPGMVLKLINKYGVDPYQSWIIGDRDSDVNVASRVPGLRPHRTIKNVRWPLPYIGTPAHAPRTYLAPSTEVAAG